MADGVVNDALEASLRYLRAGLSVLPINADGSKSPRLHSWTEFQTTRAGEAAVRDWHATNGVGVGVCGGTASGNLFVLDFEFLDYYELWAVLVEERLPGLLATLPKAWTPGKELTGSRGVHAYARCQSSVRSRKLARVTTEEALRRTGDAAQDTAIEIKGHGGYVLAPGCPAACHPTGRLYEWSDGAAVEDTPVLTDDQFKILADLARSLSAPAESVLFTADKSAPPGTHSGDRPGADFIRRGDWHPLLTRHGWVLVARRGDRCLWRRPGKKDGVSATTGFCSTAASGDMLYVFSTSAAPFQDGRAYNKFAALAILEHNGDFTAAARALGSAGYGDQTPRQRTTVSAPPAQPAASVLPAANATADGGMEWQFISGGEIICSGTPRDVQNSFIDKKGKDKPGRTVRTFDLATIGEIIDREYPAPKWVIDGVMSEGLNILAGAPKLGKSMLSLNIALTVAGGGLALGGIRVEPRNVLYLSLEDKHRRIKERALRMLQVIQPGLAECVRDNLIVPTDWPKLDEGAIDYIDDFWTSRAANPGLIIVDVWNKICPAHRGNGSAYAQDADVMGALKRYVDSKDISALVVHHTRKPGVKEPDDFVNEVSGTLGLAGAADGVLVLMRHRQDQQAHLFVTGRDVEEQELILTFDNEHLVWSSLGTSRQHITGRVQKKVEEHLANNRGTWFVTDIAEAVAEEYESVRKACNSLVGTGHVRKSGAGFTHAGTPQTPESGPENDEEED